MTKKLIAFATPTLPLSNFRLVYSDTLSHEHLQMAAALFKEAFNQPPWDMRFTLETAYQHLDYISRIPGLLSLLLFQKDDLVGLILGCIETERDGNAFCLKEFCVSDAYRGKGLGRQILGHFESELLKHKVVRHYFFTKAGSYLERFYQKNGFSILSGDHGRDILFSSHDLKENPTLPPTFQTLTTDDISAFSHTHSVAEWIQTRMTEMSAAPGGLIFTMMGEAGPYIAAGYKDSYDNDCVLFYLHFLSIHDNDAELNHFLDGIESHLHGYSGLYSYTPTDSACHPILTHRGYASFGNVVFSKPF